MSERKPTDELAGLIAPAPMPDGDRREQALSRAMARYDAAHPSVEGGHKGLPDAVRLRSRPGSSRRSAMIRARAAIAATAVIVVASPIAWKIAQDRQPALPSQEARHEPPPPSVPTIAAPAPVASVAPPADAQRRDAETAPTLAVAPSPIPVPAPAPVQADAPAALGSDAREQRLARLPPPPPVAMPAPARPAPPATKKAEADAAMRLQDSLRPAPVLTRSLPRNAPAAAEDPAIGRAAPRLRVPPEPIAPAAEEAGGDRFEARPVAGFKPVREAPVSTFSVDVDTASYGFLRASLNRNALPQPDAVRVEELINYFPYNYAPPSSSQEPFAVTARLFPSPWAEGRKILRVGIKGYELQQAGRPAANLVFLIDTSGSMSGPNRLPLVKQALSLLVAGLDSKDRVAIVTYAGGAATLLESTPASEKGKILSAIEGLRAGGGTSGGEGLRQAYALASRNRDAEAVNRVMLMTDGDFNIGITSREELKGFVARERERGIFLSVLGFGMGNYNDALMQALAQNGNGVAATIDTLNEARKVLVEEASASLFPIAKDVKIQVEFNPATVSEYRLIGYETRMLNREDFSNDRVDAGEVGSGQSVTALYEIVPRGGPRTVSDLRYGAPDAAGVDGAAPNGGSSEEFAFVKLRYKLPKEEASRLMEIPVGPSAEAASLAQADEDSRFALAVAAFGEILRGGQWTGRYGLDDVLKLASGARGEDGFGYRSEFLQLVRAAKTAQALQSARP